MELRGAGFAFLPLCVTARNEAVQIIRFIRLIRRFIVIGELSGFRELDCFTSFAMTRSDHKIIAKNIEKTRFGPSTDFSFQLILKINEL